MKKIVLTLTVFLGISTYGQKPCFPEAGMKDQSVEKEILEAFKAQGWSEQPVGVIILSRDWSIRRNEYSSVITGRAVNALVISTKKAKCITQDFNFVQSYDGSGYSKSMRMSGIGDQHKIDCECLKELDKAQTSQPVVAEKETENTNTSQSTDAKTSTGSSKDASALPKLDKTKPGYKAEKSGTIIIWEGYKKGGEVEGESRMYNDNGKIESLQHNSKGFREGYAAQFYENGKIKTEGNYKKDKQDGEWKRYSENGKLAGVDIYIDGDKQ